MEARLKQILDNVQEGSFNHQKSIKLLEKVYTSVNIDIFLQCFLKIIQGILQENYQNPCLKLLLEFLAKFVGYIAKTHDPEISEVIEDELPTHPFLSAVLKEVIKHHDLPIQECRYNACSFVSLTLQNIGDETQMDNQICDMIQEAMLENIQDPKSLIRLQAVLALTRLQDPLNPECPVIKAYIKCLNDSNHLVRKEVVIRIAPNTATIPKLKERTRDIDANVRSAAFTHIAEIGIKHFRIIDRHFILKSGFSETNSHVKKTFLELLLPRWLTTLKGDYITFLNAIKLDADESEISNTEELSKNVLEVFFKNEPIDNLIEALPLDENKVIPLNSMRNELALYWNILITYLRKSDEMDNYLNTLIPELTTFCNYIEKLIKAKFTKIMEDWEFLDFQYMLYHLFDIAENYDLSEEVGRRTLDQLIKSILRNYRLQPRLLSKIIIIASKLVPNLQELTNEVHLIISDIKEPLIDQEPTPHEQREKEFKIAEIKVKLNILQGDLEDAVDEKDFAKAQLLKNEIEEYSRKMEALSTQASQSEKIKVSKDDPETVCWCLDLLGCLLTQIHIQTLSPSLITCWEEFLRPLITSKNLEIGWRVFKCLAAYCVYDKQMAVDHLKQLLVPIASYRVIPNFNKSVLIDSVSVITDLIRIYGSEMFVTEEEQNITTSTNTTKRKLYNQEAEGVNLISDQMSVDLILNVILDMLDDEIDEIRNTAVTAVAKLILNGFPVTPMVITRLILKWYNPITQKSLQQKLGVIITEYADRIKDAKAVIAKAVVPILTNIAEAPKTSPLAVVDIENVIKFLSTITNSGYTNELGNTHRDLAHLLIGEVSSRPSEQVTPHLAKMLTFLDIVPDESPLTKELSAHTELVMEKEIFEKSTKHHLTKFVSKLNGNVSFNQKRVLPSTANNKNVDGSATIPTRRLSSVIEEFPEDEAAQENQNENIFHEENDDSSNGKEKGVEDSSRENSEASQDSNDQAIVRNDLSASDSDVILPNIRAESPRQVNKRLSKTRSSSNSQLKTGKRKRTENVKPKEKPSNEKVKDVEGSNHGSNDGSRNNARNDRPASVSDVFLPSSESEERSIESQPRNSRSNSQLKSVKRKRPEKVKHREKPEKTGNVGRTCNDRKESEEPGGTETEDGVPDHDKNKLRSRRKLRSNMKKIENKRTLVKGKNQDTVSSSSSSSSSTDSKKREKVQNKPVSVKNPLQNKRNNLRNHSRKTLDGNNKENTSDSQESSESIRKSSSGEDKLLLRDSRLTFNEDLDVRRRLSSRRSLSSPIISEDRIRIRPRSDTTKALSTNLATSGNISPPGAHSSADLVNGKTRLNGRNKTTKSLSINLATSGNISPPGAHSSDDGESRLNGRNKNKIMKENKKLLVVLRRRAGKRIKYDDSDESKKGYSRTESSVGDSDEAKKSSAARGRKDIKGVNVDAKAIARKVNGVNNLRNTPQIKRKKGRRVLAKNVSHKSILSNHSFDTSEQSLHTIIEPSELHMSLLSDSSPESTPQKILRNSRRLHVVTELTSDSDSSHSPLRKSLRNSRKKVYSGAK